MKPALSRRPKNRPFMKTRHQELQQRNEGWRPTSPVNLTERYKSPSILSARSHPRPHACHDRVAPALGEDYHALHETFEVQADARPDAPAAMPDREGTPDAEPEARANRPA